MSGRSGRASSPALAPRRQPLLLLPPSKGKAAGGDGPTYAAVLASSDNPLTAARQEVLAALGGAVPALADGPLARLAGVRPRDVDGARHLLRCLPGAPTLPARRRYTGVVHGNAGLATLTPANERAEALLVSPLLGLVGLDEPVPHYRLEFGASLPGLGGLATSWRDRLASHLAELAADRRVWDLLPGEHARVWPAAARAGADVVTVRFVRPDGRAANAARTKVAKGRLAGHLLRHADAEPGAGDAAGLLGPGWVLERSPGVLVATWTGA